MQGELFMDSVEQRAGVDRRVAEELPTGTINVVVEIPRGSRNKYEQDESGVVRFDRRLVGSISFPGDYGFVPHTIGPDGDALDALVLISEPTFPGVVIPARPIGVLWISVSAEPKLICVPDGDPAWEGTRDLDELPRHLVHEVQQFFNTYRALEAGATPTVYSYEGAAQAWQAVSDARRSHGDGSRSDDTSSSRPGGQAGSQGL